MANIDSAKKRARQSAKIRSHNAALRSELRTAIKKVRALIQNGSAEQARTEFNLTQSRIDAMAGKQIIHKNTASRYKSRLSASIKGINS